MGMYQNFFHYKVVQYEIFKNNIASTFIVQLENIKILKDEHQFCEGKNVECR